MNRSVPNASLIALLALALASCATRAGPDPFSAGSSRRVSDAPAVRVTLEVVCDACVISYSIGATTGSARQHRLNPVWLTRLVRYPVSSEMIRLSARSDGGAVHRARIFVDGEVVAVDDNDAARSRTMLCASAMIPRRTDSEEPSGGGCSERSDDTSEGRP